ncbi:MAG: methionine--tRNA ligase [bacterium]
MPRKPYYITTPIYYVNDIPHVGHTCTTLVADVLARYQKERGREAFFLTGTDEHGAKIAEAAKKAGKEPQEFTNEVSQRFVEAWKLLNFEYDYFIRTTNPKHKTLAQGFLQRLYDQGDIYKGHYEGLYCVGCEKFITEKELVDGKCPLHEREPEKQSEENYFFKLSAYIPKVKELIEKDIFRVSPENKKKEILNKIEAGVRDLSISRANVTWGIPIPWDSRQTIYVWFEALLNYWTAPQMVGQELWPPGIQFIGKEIAWFHCVIWPAMLLSYGETLPKEVFVHDFYNLKGIKISKSLGNMIGPSELVEKFGVDGARYLLAVFFPHSSDTALAWELMINKYNADLANGLGNLVSRLAALAEKNQVSPYTPFTPLPPLTLWDEYNLPQILEGTWEKLRALDKELNEKQPWKLEPEKARPVLSEIIGKLLQLNSQIKPFLPQTTTAIEAVFAANPTEALKKPLFPRL